MKHILSAIFILFLSSCTTEYLKDNGETYEKRGYERISYDGKRSYKPSKRKKVTVMKPLINPLKDEEVDDLLALPVGEVSEQKLKTPEIEKEEVVVIEEDQDKGILREAISIFTQLYKDTDEEKEEIKSVPPKPPVIDEKQVKATDKDIKPISDYSNILTLMDVVKFSGVSFKLSDENIAKIKEVSVIKKEDGGRVKLVAYDFKSGNGKLLKQRIDSIVSKLKEYNVDKSHIISVTENTENSDLIGNIEIYLEY
jgi:hypothetical protein